MRRKLLLILVILSPWFVAKSQTDVNERAMISFGRGVGFNAPDSIFSLTMRMRMQNRIVATFDENLNAENIEARTSRLRLRFDGFIVNSKLTYYLQLGFSRNDQDWENTKMANVVRDAMIYYHFNHNFYLGFGQGKLPGNRQGITSSGQQQFWERSNVHANFSLERDFGVFSYYSNKVGGVYYNLKAAISTGDGRNQLRTDKGLAYTARVELMPFGKFVNDGDFSEGDLEFEKTPKISIAAAYSINEKARRTRGTGGTDLYSPRNTASIFADMVLKYRGWALSTEYINRSVEGSPYTYNPTDSTLTAFVVTGHGLNTQLSYCFRNYWEITARYSVVEPATEIRSNAMLDTYYVAGVNKYIKKHLTKLQAFVGYRTQESYTVTATGKNNLLFIIQIELGI